MTKRKKKDVTEMTTDELARHVFPKKVVAELKRVAHQGDEKDDSEGKPEQSASSRS
ncbi:MAG: hypothetical protein HY666_00875 [Chloroflexi bacterium]|nr:hypothetical protein [Chloroflexota bacterium]